LFFIQQNYWMRSVVHRGTIVISQVGISLYKFDSILGS
jgi:hypothetical protein